MMFSPRHIGTENCCYNAEAERARAEYFAEYWKKEAEKWKAKAKAKGCDEDKYEQLDKRLKKVEAALAMLLIERD